MLDNSFDFEAQTRSLALASFDLFCRGLAGDSDALAQFIEEMHPDVVVYFPEVSSAGGAYTKEQLPSFFGFVRRAYPSGLTIELDRLFVSGDTAGFQFHDEGVSAKGDDYRGSVFISFQFRDGKLWRYREYFGLRWNMYPAFP